MKRLTRWLGWTLGGLAGVALLATAGVGLLSWRSLSRAYPLPPPASLGPLPSDSAAIAEGRRLATIRGCSDGCHGNGVAGTVFWDEPGVARIVAPDLTQAAARYSDVELEAIIRHGLRPDGRSVIAMPSEMFRYLRDEELARILAYLRSVPPANGPAPEVTVGWKGRLGLALGEFHTTEHYVRKVESVRFEVPDSLADGLYLARTACTECHSTDLTGDSSGKPPDLKIVAGYSEAQFRHFLHTGEALGGRELPLMSDMARRRFSAFTEAEVTALYHYLRSRAGG